MICYDASSMKWVRGQHVAIQVNQHWWCYDCEEYTRGQMNTLVSVEWTFKRHIHGNNLLFITCWLLSFSNLMLIFRIWHLSFPIFQLPINLTVVNWRLWPKFNEAWVMFCTWHWINKWIIHIRSPW